MEKEEKLFEKKEKQKAVGRRRKTPGSEEGGLSLKGNLYEHYRAFIGTMKFTEKGKIQFRKKGRFLN